MKRIAACAIALCSLAPLSAQALSVADFTDGDFWGQPVSNPVSEVIDGVTVTVEGIPNLNNNEALNSPTLAFAGGTLAARRDGFGVINDEVTEGGVQSIEVTFAGAPVVVSELAFLDMFVHDNNSNRFERAQVEFFDGATSLGVQTVDAQLTSSQNRTGYVTAASSISGAITKLIFTAAFDPSDPGKFRDDGTNDFAPAAIAFTVVPLPAPALMLLGALGGFTFLRRRRAA